MEIRIEHLYKKYGGQEVLRDVSFRIPAGMYGLLGSCLLYTSDAADEL